MKPFEGFTAETIDFLWELRMNNSREWMEENRDRYKRVLKEPFDSLAAALVAESIAFGVQLEIEGRAFLPCRSLQCRIIQHNPTACAVRAFILGKADIAIDTGNGAFHFPAAEGLSLIHI